MGSAIQLGPMIIHQSWIVLAGGFLVGYLLLTFHSPFRGSEWREQRETVGTGIGLFIITFFFGTIILQLDRLFTDPMAVLSYPSGSNELYLALVVIIIYFLLMSWKKQMPIINYIHGILYIVLPTTFIYAFFEQKQGAELWPSISSIVPWSHHPVFLYMMMISGSLLVWLFQLEKQRYKGSKVLVIFLLWVIGFLLTTLIDNFPLFFGIPITPLFYFVLLLTGIGIGISDLVKKKEVD